MALDFLKKSDAVEAAKVRSVGAALARLQKARRLVDVAFDGDTQGHQSIIVRVAPEAGCLLIDELFPTDDGRQGHPGQACTISTRERGVEITFSTRVLGRVQASDGHAYKLALPASIERRERRDAFRLRTAHLSGARASLPMRDGERCEAAIFDVSTKGIGLEFEGDRSEQFARGDRIEGCRFQMKEDLVLECDVVVRNVRFERDPGRRTLVGAILIDLPPDRRRALERLLAVEQRERAKRGLPG